MHVAANATAGSASATFLAELGAMSADGAGSAPATCGDGFGVLAGSVAMDGRGGTIQRTAACEQKCMDPIMMADNPRPPPPPSPPPPPAPPAQCSTYCTNGIVNTTCSAWSDFGSN